MFKHGGSTMNEQVKDYVEKYPNEIVIMFGELRELIYSSTSKKPEEKLWAKLPIYMWVNPL